MFREKQMSRMRALKVLAFAMSGLSKIGALEVCEKFVDNQGLKHVFSAFMKKVHINSLKFFFSNCLSLEL